MAHSFTEDDEGKTVVNDQGDEVGIIADVEHGTAYVDPDPGVTDKIKSKLGWDDRGEDTYPLQEESVDSVTDDEIRLGSATTAGSGVDAGTGGSATTAGSGANTPTGDTGTTGTGTTDSGLTDDDDGLLDDDDDTIGSDDDDGIIGDDDDTIGDDDDGLLDDDDDTIGDDDDGLLDDDGTRR